MLCATDNILRNIPHIQLEWWNIQLNIVHAILGLERTKSILSRTTLSLGNGNCRDCEPGVRANALGTLPATERVPSRELPLSAIFSSLT